MIRLGLTGGIGSGKSNVAKVFEALGTSVYYADDEAKKFLDTSEVKAKLCSIFGNNIINKNGDVIRSELASVVFKSKKSLDKLNSLIHPLLLNHFDNWCKQKAKIGEKFIVMEAAILFEANFDSYVDKTLCITAPLQDRLSRVTKRDGISVEQVEARIRNQWSQEKLSELSDYTIKNSNKSMILESIIRLHYELSNGE